MKIIKQGKKIVGTMEVSCPKCEAVLQIQASDLKATGFGGTYSYICPCCNRSHHINWINLNEDIRFDLPK